MRKIKIEIDGEWVSMTWAEINDAILFGNNLTHCKIKLSTNRFDREGVELFEGDKIVLFNELYPFEYEIVWDEDGLTFIAYCSEEFLYPDDWCDFKIIK